MTAKPKLHIKAALGVSVLLAASVLSALVRTPTAVRAAIPIASISRYANDLTGNTTNDFNTFVRYGCSQASDAAGTSATYEAIVSFAEQWYQNGALGTLDWNLRFHNSSDISSAVQGYAFGFYVCATSVVNSANAPLPFLELAVGINNNGPFMTTQGGTDWANFVTGIQNQENSSSVGGLASIIGGNDLEPSYNTAAASSNWSTGYSAMASAPRYVDFGSADGCPTSGSAAGINLSCSYGWTQQDEQWVSWGARLAFSPVPEIYVTNGAQAIQWQQISLYSVLNNRPYGMVYFDGALTQSQACRQRPSQNCAGNGTNNTPQQGFQQLTNALNSDSRTSNGAPLLSSDIRWDV